MGVYATQFLSSARLAGLMLRQGLCLHWEACVIGGEGGPSAILCGCARKPGFCPEYILSEECCESTWATSPGWHISRLKCCGRNNMYRAHDLPLAQTLSHRELLCMQVSAQMHSEGPAAAGVQGEPTVSGVDAAVAH